MQSEPKHKVGDLVLDWDLKQLGMIIFVNPMNYGDSQFYYNVGFLNGAIDRGYSEASITMLKDYLNARTQDRRSSFNEPQEQKK